MSTEEALHALGRPALAVRYGGVSAPDWYGGATSRICVALEGKGPITVVAHSAAGGLVPGLTRALAERMRGFVLVDAVSPYPGKAWIDTVPPELAARLKGMGGEAGLPPWDRWLGDGVLERLLPDSALRARFRAEAPRLPLAYFEASAPDADEWRSTPAAYLQLSEAYSSDAKMAEASGWRVRREPLHHLAMLTHPRRVAELVAAMADELAAG
jgi:hypothetical protein